MVVSEGDNNVSALNACVFGGSALGYAGNISAAGKAIVNFNAEVRCFVRLAVHAVFNNIVANFNGGVNGDTEAHSLVSVGGNFYVRDTDKTTRRIDKGSARVTGVNSGVGLDKGHCNRVNRQLTVKAAYNSACNRAGKLNSAGVTDCDNRLTQNKLRRVAYFCSGKTAFFNFKNGKVGGGVIADYLSFDSVFVIVGKVNLNFRA